MISVLQAAEKIGVSEQQLFVRARNFMSASGSPTADFQHWKDLGIMPRYVSEFLRHVELMPVPSAIASIVH